MTELTNFLNQTVTAVGVARNRIGTAALFAVQRHLANIFRQKRLQTLNARAKFVSEQFRSDDDHPFIWYQYTVSDIPNHPETGGYRIVRVKVLAILRLRLSDRFIDPSWRLPVRANSRSVASLLLLFRNHGVPTN